MGNMTKLFYTDKPIIGLDISNTGIKIMAINPKRWLVLGYGSLDLEPIKVKESLEGNSTYLAENIQLLIKEKLIGLLPSNHVLIGVPTSRSYSRTFNLPLSVEHKLKDAVELEVDQYIPVPSSTLYIDYKIIERSKTEITVLMSAVSKTIIDKCIAAAESAGLVVSAIEPGMSAVAHLIAKTEEGHLPSVIVDIGPASTDIAVLDSGNIRVTSSLNIGGNTFTLDIAKKLNVALENAHQLKVLNGLSAGPRQEKIKAAIEPSLKQIIVDTHKVMRYYNERINDDRKLEQLLIVGSGSNMPGIGEYFTDVLVMPARVASPWQKLDFRKLPEPARQFRPRYITVAGLASITHSEYSTMINLLPDKTKKQIKAARANVILAKFVAVLCVAAIFLALACGVSYLLLDGMEATAKAQSANSKAGIVSPYQRQMDTINKSINTAKTILDAQMSYSKVITELAATMPSGVVIESISLDSSTINQPLTLTLHARLDSDILKFKSNIQASSIFSNYTVQTSDNDPASNISGYPITTTVNVTINKSAIK